MKIKLLCLVIISGFCTLYCQEMRMPQMQHMQKKMIRNMENDALLRMINELEITDEQMPSFILKFREMAEMFRQQKEDRDKIIDELRRMISKQEPKEKIESKITELEKYYDRMYEDFKKFRSDIKKILTPEQMMNFLLMVDDIKNMLVSSPGMPGMPLRMMETPRKIQEQRLNVPVPQPPVK